MFGFIEKLSHALFGIAGIIMKLTPIGAFDQPVGGLAASLSSTKATPLAKAIGKDVKLTAEVINLLNRKVSDVDYFYEPSASRSRSRQRYSYPSG